MSKIAVIAGIGAGLGAALARKFVAEDCAVALLSRSTEFSSNLVTDLTANGGKALALEADVSDSASVDRAFEQIRQLLGPVDILVNHASASSWKGLLEASPEEMERAWRVSASARSDASGAKYIDIAPVSNTNTKPEARI